LKKSLIVIILIFISFSTWALPSQVVCKAENISDNIDKFGSVVFTFEPLTAVWTGRSGLPKKIFDQNIICGRDISNTSVKPGCYFEDISDSDLRYTLTCDTQYQNGIQWFAKGGLVVSEITKNGRFECRTKYGSNYFVVLNLTACQ